MLPNKRRFAVIIWLRCGREATLALLLPSAFRTKPRLLSTNYVWRIRGFGLADCAVPAIAHYYSIFEV
jgi:hypothetical protein